ncbi:DNA-formamidopyrimidine glycosylase family protein [Ornithinimicrobium faecis]|uniref:DNA-formamidopyrimidine glycosylase family protein n=1 Tax=Ornithinimicrobium faecis TaxID=2934158 RepID=UPI00211797FD|nr:DNA-formamidopyrimidine glycosylase family protein [Ornithinimicrobium sp. HY1745]
MPEGDAVWRTARRLHRALTGKVLLGADLRVPALATRDLTGRATLEVLPRGKHLLHRLEGGITLHSHLRMDGSWRVLTRTGGDGSVTDALGVQTHPATRPHTVRAVLWTRGHLAVGDSLGMLDLVETRHEERLVGHLGPDLLDRTFDRDRALSHLVRDPLVPVAVALLDQRNLAGIGTIYASEPLFEHRVSPWAPVGDVDPEVLGRVIDTARLWMVRSCRVGHDPSVGPLTRQPADGWLPGTYRVFGRSGRPCRRCGAVIVEQPIGQQPRQRVISFCPACQGS